MGEWGANGFLNSLPTAFAISSLINPWVMSPSQHGEDPYSGHASTPTILRITTLYRQRHHI